MIEDGFYHILPSLFYFALLIAFCGGFIMGMLVWFFISGKILSTILRSYGYDRPIKGG